MHEESDSDDGESTDDDIEDSDEAGEDDSDFDRSDDDDVDLDGDTDEEIDPNADDEDAADDADNTSNLDLCIRFRCFEDYDSLVASKSWTLLSPE